MDIGRCAYTTGGKLYAKYVIHAVGPIWHGGNRDETEALFSCVTDSFLLANEILQCESISIPAISSGIYGFPKDRCAYLMMEAAMNFFKSTSVTITEEQDIREGNQYLHKNYLKTINFCNLDESTVKYFVAEFDRRFHTDDKNFETSEDQQENQINHVKKNKT